LVKFDIKITIAKIYKIIIIKQHNYCITLSFISGKIVLRLKFVRELPPATAAVVLWLGRVVVCTAALLEEWYVGAQF
jgi:hypothetical protein